MDRIVQGDNGADGQSGLAPTDGGQGQPALAVNAGSQDLRNDAEAVGGNGGNGGNYTGGDPNIASGQGGLGGDAQAQTTMTLATSSATSASASASGGDAGNGGLGLSTGGQGGTASAQASDTNRQGPAIASAYALGGASGASMNENGTAGGSATNTTAWAIGPQSIALAFSIGGIGGSSHATQPGFSAGTGGVASGTKAVAVGITSARATAIQIGGDGGAGTFAGGNGASSTLVNAVAGTSQRGTLNLSQEAVAGNGGSSAAGAGGNSGDATSILSVNDMAQPQAEQSLLIRVGSEAVGANAMDEGAGQIPGTAGTSIATVRAVGNAAANVTADALSLGGRGGSEGLGGVGNGTTGGTARAAAVATGFVATATIEAHGGEGGVGRGAGAAGGTGGIGTGSAIALASGTANSTLTLVGGPGGFGMDGANGGAGAAETVANAVFAKSAAGTLTLDQNASGGAGGNSDTGVGGAGGDAFSSLSFTNTTATNLIYQSNAYGGEGGFGGGGDGTTGTAFANVSVVTNAHVLAFATAASGGLFDLNPGSANAGAEASGTFVNVKAAAESLAGGPAIASATGLGPAGKAWAGAKSGAWPDGNPVNDLVYGASAYGSATVSAEASLLSAVIQGDAAPTFVTNLTAATSVLEAPAAASQAVTSVFSANPHIAGGFGGTPQIFGLGEIGAAHASQGSDSEQSSSETDITVNLAALSSAGDLTFGLYNGQSIGTGVTAVTLTVSIVGHDTLLSRTFTGASAASEAVALFTDKSFDFGSLIHSGEFNFDIQLTVTSDSPGAGFCGEFIIGNHPTGLALTPQEPMPDHAWRPMVESLFHI